MTSSSLYLLILISTKYLSIRKVFSLTNMILSPTFKKNHHETKVTCGEKGRELLVAWYYSYSFQLSNTYSPIHKAAGLTVPGRSMILPGTIPETSISREWSRRLERPLGVVSTAGRTPTGGFVNSAVTFLRFMHKSFY